PAEVLHRLGERGRREVSRRRHQGWARYPARDLHPVWPALRARVAAAAPAQRAAIAASAGAFLAGRFAALGRDWPAGAAAAPYEQFWRLDPVTGGAWPDAGQYCFAIDFRHDGGRGDVKYVWEANRLQFLPALAAHVVLTGDEKSLAVI